MLKTRWLGALLAFSTAPVWAANYAQCLLETLANSQSGVVHAASVSLCTTKNPDGFYTIKRGSGRGLFGFKSADVCTIESAKNTRWQPSAVMIRRACTCLYSEPSSDTDMCERYVLSQDILIQHPDGAAGKKRLALEHHYRRIYSAHPDADHMFGSKAFWAWVAEYKRREAALSEGKTQEIISLFKAYKAESPEWENGVITQPSYTPFHGKLDGEK